MRGYHGAKQKDHWRGGTHPNRNPEVMRLGVLLSRFLIVRLLVVRVLVGRLLVVRRLVGRRLDEHPQTAYQDQVNTKIEGCDEDTKVMSPQ